MTDQGRKKVGLSTREKDLLAAYAEVWPAPVDREITDAGTRLVLEIDGFDGFPVGLLDRAAPRLTVALRAILPFEGRLIHSAWSGSGVRALGAMDLPGVEAHENSTYFPVPGDVCYTVGHAEFSIFYGDASPAMPSGRVRESVFAVVESRLPELQNACMLTRLTGVRRFTLRPA